MASNLIHAPQIHCNSNTRSCVATSNEQNGFIFHKHYISIGENLLKTYPKLEHLFTTFLIAYKQPMFEERLVPSTINNFTINNFLTIGNDFQTKCYKYDPCSMFYKRLSPNKRHLDSRPHAVWIPLLQSSSLYIETPEIQREKLGRSSGQRLQKSSRNPADTQTLPKRAAHSQQTPSPTQPPTTKKKCVEKNHNHRKI